MAAATLNCPMCGASASTDSHRCEHCGARLATVACPSCFGMVFVGAKFCSHCGARANRSVPEPAAAQCPRCSEALQALNLGGTPLLECARCGGIWADNPGLEKICADQDQQSLVLGAAQAIPGSLTGTVERNIRYVPCPVCRKLMNRVNFARCSQVVVDVCKGHGTWFDRDELRRIVEFIRAGGLQIAREKEVRALEERRRQVLAERVVDAFSPSRARDDYVDARLGISSAGRLIRDLFP